MKLDLPSFTGLLPKEECTELQLPFLKAPHPTATAAKGHGAISRTATASRGREGFFRISPLVVRSFSSLQRRQVQSASATQLRSQVGPVEIKLIDPSLLLRPRIPHARSRASKALTPTHTFSAHPPRLIGLLHLPSSKQMHQGVALAHSLSFSSPADRRETGREKGMVAAVTSFLRGCLMA